MIKKTVTLRSRLPPVYNASGKTVVIDMDNPKGDLQTELLVALENQLTQDDSSIHVGGTRPDLKIECKITHVGAPQRQQTSENNITTVRLVGSLSVALRISEPSSNHVIKSALASSDYNEEMSHTTSATSATKVFGHMFPGSGPTTTPVHSDLRSEEEVHQFLVRDAATKIASFVVNTEQTVPVLLAGGGGLDSADKLAQSGLWARNLEELETLSPLSEPRYEAYRLYNIGVANEALAYQAQDSKSAVKYLEQASNDYGKALEQRPEEKYFLQPQNRIKSALSHYTEIDRSTASSGQPSSAKLVTGEASANEHALSNEDILDMVGNHLDDANILDTIQTSPQVKFDITPQGQIQLAKGGVKGPILMAMKQRMRGTQPTSAKK